MPAFRSRKYTCAGYLEEANQARKDAQKQARKAKALREKMMTEEEKEADKIEKLARKAARETKKEWEASLVSWTPTRDFRFPVGTMALYKSDAKSAYSITEKEILTLKHESIPGSLKTFFSQADVQELAKKKFEAGAHKPDVRFAGQVKGELRLFAKVDNSNVSRRKNFEAQFAGYVDPSYYRRGSW